MYRVLVVDDSATDRTLLKGLLVKHPAFEVECVASGREALEAMGRHQPSVVVTDMQMPEMDGLELVSAVRNQFPQVPVILITGQGSEALAAKALRRGAAGYVAKSQSAQHLCETVHHVLDLLEAAVDHARLLEASTDVHFEFVLPNDPSLIRPLQDLAQRMTGAMGVCDSTGCLQVGVALEHAVANAMYHGNLELTADEFEQVGRAPDQVPHWLTARRLSPPCSARRVRVTIHVTRDEARFIVGDDGRGFDVQEVTNVGLTRSLSGGSGRGLFLMWAFMDKVTFDKTGAKVTMVKRRDVTLNPSAVDTSANVDDTSLPRLDPARPAGDQPAMERPTGNLGLLVAREGGRPIVLTKPRLTVGRLESCDLVLNHPKISHHHCVLCLHQGWWFVKDLHSKNGTKVNQAPVVEQVLRPGSTLTLGSLDFEIRYSPHDLGAVGITPPPDPF
ncbi:MAG: response regulator [Pirellulales bacterium]